MVEDDEAVVKTDVAIGQFQIVDRAARQFRLGEIFQVVAPVAERAAERKRQINFIEQFEARHQRIEQMPRVAEMDCELRIASATSNFAARAEGTEGQKRIDRDE